jgi:hypothetical protein
LQFRHDFLNLAEQIRMVANDCCNGVMRPNRDHGLVNLRRMLDQIPVSLPSRGNRPEQLYEQGREMGCGPLLAIDYVASSTPAGEPNCRSSG